jgi:hypothetical protein
MKRSSPCQGAIKRSYGEFPCTTHAAYAVRNNDTDAVLGACRHHLAQVIDSMDAKSALVVPLPVNSLDEPRTERVEFPGSSRTQQE